ncbi:MAG: cation transporter [Ignavibacteriaceae bacterium]|mgnify:CR=1 FL=1|nr:cation transporter [Ignavibacterium sp.]MCC6256241.1 cation transporter [Ignavibacteriaceae bacterium]HRN27801.1 cation diffusion facilitator family transporter [Ignavibacteriaceae bacterium]HRP94007.1 cation diffusion facilitator family transporter [Ignavibacteriaceae bacterium]HRQ55410.1 cation diffusion facilitator family transporter [Ignavibacteriaceae bacterium]
MSHNHSHTNSNSIKNFKVVFFLNFGFTLFEIVGGIYTNSIAIISDALHDLGDSISIGLAWFLEKYSHKKSDHKFTYGYGRFSLLGALINAIVLIIGSTFVLATAIPRLIKPEVANAEGMIVFAIIGVIVNGAAVLKLKGEESMNARVMMLHLIEDVLGWIAILAVAITLLFWQNYILDAILSIIITIYILYNVVINLKKTITLFLQATPDNVNIEFLDNKLKSIDKVISSHHTHVWSLDGANHILTTHLIVDKSTTRGEIIKIKSKCKQLFEDLKITHLTIEIELEDEVCLMEEDHKH